MLTNMKINQCRKLTIFGNNSYHQNKYFEEILSTVSDSIGWSCPRIFWEISKWSNNVWHCPNFSSNQSKKLFLTSFHLWHREKTKVAKFWDTFYEKAFKNYFKINFDFFLSSLFANTNYLLTAKSRMLTLNVIVALYGLIWNEAKLLSHCGSQEVTALAHFFNITF